MYWIMGASGLLSSLYPNVDDHQWLFESFVQAWNSHQLRLPHGLWRLQMRHGLPGGVYWVCVCVFKCDKIPALVA